MTQGGPVDGSTPKVNGRMVRSNSYKYCIYDQGKQPEELFDMKNDRLETKNLATDPSYKDVLKTHRNYLEQHAKMYNDKLAKGMLDQPSLDMINT